MNKKRFGSLSVRHWAMIFALAALTAVYVTRSDGSGLMAATTTRELPVYNVDTEEKVLSISFDAAWGNANTEGILNILDQYGVKTNFFLVGFWAEKYPELVAELQARGHEVGNHSATHPHMSKLSDSQIREELKRCSDLVQSITGKPTTLFRPPYGEYNDEVVRISREEGYECIQWNVDSLDWKNISAEDMVRRCTKNVNPGDIVLDPFAGIGSVPYQAVLMGRRGLGIELKDSYYAQAVKNLEGAASEADSHEINTNVRLRCPVCGIKVDGKICPLCGKDLMAKEE